METILEVEGLTKHYPNFELDHLSFSLEAGYVMGFIGRNGAGKTTTIKMIMGLIHRDGGVVRLFGREVPASWKAVSERIGFVYDEPCFHRRVTVAETEAIIAPFYRQWDRAQYARLVHDFGLDPRRRVSDLSHGQKTLLALVVALSHNAELIIMDEPTSGLDPVFRSELVELLYEIVQDEKRAVLFSTHITSDLEKIADYITLIDGGRLILSDTKDEIVERYRMVRGPADELTEETRRLCKGIRETTSGFEALSDHSEQVAAIVGDRCVTERATLDEIMVHLVGRRQNGR